MADSTATFALQLEGNWGVAQQGVGALEQLREKIQADTQALQQMQQAMRRLQGGTVVNLATQKELKDRIAAQKATIASATDSYVRLGGSFQKANKPAQAVSITFRQQAANARAAVVPALALGAAMIGVAAGFAAAAGAMGLFGLRAADARRSEALQLEGMTKLRYMMGGMFAAPKHDSVGFLQETLDLVSSKVPLARGEVAQLEASFYRLGLRGGNLQHAVEGMALSLAGGGEAAGAQFKAMALGAGALGGSIKKVADDARARFGGIVARQMMSLDVQAAKLKENLRFLFGGLKIEKLLEGLSSMTQLFSASTESGKALRVLAETMLQPIIDALAIAGPMAKDFFRGMVIGGLLVVIGLQKLRNKWVEVFGESTMFDDLDTFKIAIYGGIGAVGLLTAGVMALAGAGVALGAAFAIVNAPLTLAASLATAMALAVRHIKEVGWKQAGLDIVRGLVDGIKGGVTLFNDAVVALAKGGWRAFKSVFQIQSPSRVARLEGGRNIGMGVALGLRDTQPLVARGMRGLGNVRDISSAPGLGGPRAEPQAAVAALPPIQVTINIDGKPASSPDLEALVARGVSEAFEKLAIQIGARKAA